MATAQAQRTRPATHRTPADFDKAEAEYLEELRGLDEAQLRKEANQMIWLSAYASNNARSDYHWKVDAVFGECERRGRGDIYREEHAKLMREAR